MLVKLDKTEGEQRNQQYLFLLISSWWWLDGGRESLPYPGQTWKERRAKYLPTQGRQAPFLSAVVLGIWLRGQTPRRAHSQPRRGGMEHQNLILERKFSNPWAEGIW